MQVLFVAGHQAEMAAEQPRTGGPVRRSDDNPAANRGRPSRHHRRRW